MATVPGVEEARVMLSAWRVCLDPTKAQQALLAQHAGAARWAYNHALGRKVAAHQAFTAARDAVLAGVDEPSTMQLQQATAAARQAGGRIPGYVENMAQWRQIRGDDRQGLDGVSPWWHTVSSYAISSGMRAADTAFQAWFDSRAGRRAGRAVGYPRFKKKGRSRLSFSLYHDVKRPTIRVEDARHVQLPRIGRVRLHSNLRRLIRLQARDELQIRSVTVSRQGQRWFASILVAHPAPAVGPSRQQAAAGVVGVDLGVKAAATLSDGTLVPNPRWGRAASARLVKAQRALSRTQRGSANRAKARQRLARVQAELAERRTGWLHQVTKRLATGWAVVAVEDLNVAGMTRSARGTIERPGRHVRQKAGLNRAILDVSFGEFRRQLAYKTGWYGSELAVVDRWLPSSKTCSACGWLDTELTLADRTFHCRQCGLVVDRDLNAARNIAAAALDPDRQLNGADQRVRTKPAPATDGRPQPDTRDARDPEATYRVPTELTPAKAGASVDVGRPPPPGGGHPGRAIDRRSSNVLQALP